jgi:5-methylcytosine-specific restriction endonuclease McrA
MEYDTYPASRSEAKFLGLKYYFTGLPCKHGHIALRKTKGSCLECLRIEWERGKTLRKDYFSAYNHSDAGKRAKQQYYEQNRDKIIGRAKNQAVEARRRYKKAWKQANPSEVKASQNDRRRRHKNATPSWLTDADKREIRRIYREAIAKTASTGIVYVVDHIIPLRGKTVCGLHVPTNLAIITAEENYQKSNKHLDTGPNPA